MRKKGMGSHDKAVMKSDEWLTPPEIIQSLGEFDLDPCAPVFRPWPTAAQHYTIIDNGLQKDWFGRVWLNPPYGRNIGLWMKKMHHHNNGIALTFARTDTDSFQRYVFPYATSLFFLSQRLNFYTVGGTRSRMTSGSPSVLIAYGSENAEAIDKAGFKGKHVSLVP